MAIHRGELSLRILIIIVSNYYNLLPLYIIHFLTVVTNYDFTKYIV